MATSQAAVKRYKAKMYKRVPLEMRKDDYEDLKTLCEEIGEPVNTFIKAAIAERIKRFKAEQGQLDAIGFEMAEDPGQE